MIPHGPIIRAGFRRRPPSRRERASASPASFSGLRFRFRPWVELMEDRTLLATFLVNTTADNGAGSLRQAILDSNAATGGTSTIDFAILGHGARVISPLSPLPAITNPVLIDGSSQPGYSGTPLIELSGAQAGTGDGLTITGSGSTIRGLEIIGFVQGAGILISGTGATKNAIEANDIGTDPAGVQALPNDFGVQISSGASNNLVGGTTSAAGNLIAFNTGPGVDVEGDTSVGNQITANRIFANDDQGALQFDGSNYVSLPNGLVDDSGPSGTFEASFQTSSGGVILGYQAASPGVYPSNGWVPTLYVGTDGKLYGGSYDTNLGSIEQVTSNGTVNDGEWHNVALVIDGEAGTMTLYLDGELIGSVSGSPQYLAGSFNQVGTGYTDSWPATPGGWYGFTGQINDVRVWSGARSAGEISQDMSAPPGATEPGLEADYPLDDGQGLTANDQTPNHNNGRLAAISGDFPAWVVASGEAIDLGDDGITYNSSAPRQGPNNLQNFPIIATTADGGLEGWLGGSTPETTFRIDVYASAGYSAAGAGQAQDYLGSLEVTTDSQGQAVFDVPFSPPEGLPMVTATATDPLGNTSEVSAQRSASLEAPAQYAHVVPGQPLVFSASLGDGIDLQDPDAGPLDPAWDVTLSVTEGTLTLSSLSGLVGSGDGTGTLQYQGPLSALNAALEGMSYSQAAGAHGSVTLTLAADSAGAPTVAAQVIITDGFFSVTTTADSGPGSLRQAILDSDAATSVTSTIDFAIPGKGVQMIAPISPLPPITNSVLIDGFSQPGYAGTPLIELSGSEEGSGDGLTITGAGVTVRGLDINSFSQGAGIRITGTGATHNWVYGDFAGTDPTGTFSEPNDSGVAIDGGASNNLIGTNGDGADDQAERNLLSGNLFAGVSISGEGTDGNAVAGNFLGTDISGSVALDNGTQPVGDSQGNRFGGGVAVSGGASDNRIGTDGASVDDVGERNVIAGSDNDGIDIYGDGTDENVVAGNFIGTDVAGTHSLGIAGDGVFLAEGASFNWIGVNPIGGPAFEDDGNVISGNGNFGVQMVSDETDDNVVAGNKIGTDVTGTVAVENVDWGVVLQEAAYNTVGGSTAGAGNLVSGNIEGGVAIVGIDAIDDVVQGNLIGTDVTGTRGLGNGGNGVYVGDFGTLGDEASDATIGGSNAGAGNLITDNSGAGVVIQDTGSVGNQITANRIFGNTGQAIDLGDDEITDNASAPRQGPNNLQNFPVVIATDDGSYEGWLGGSTPESVFRLDFFANASYGPGGAGEAQDYLGSMEVTTDATGLVNFAVPFTAPAGLPIITATATDPQGNTSEVSSLLPGGFQAGSAVVRLVPGQESLAFSAASGDGIDLQDSFPGSYGPPSELTLLVSAGTLTLASTAGLVGSGDETGSLFYTGTLSALDAAMAGMTYAPPAGFRGNVSLSVQAESDGIALLAGQVIITTRSFVVTTTADSGPGSLRQAILDSNAATGATNTTDFEIPGSGVRTIVTLLPLPAITNPLVIDGTTQRGYAGVPLIAIVGQGTGDADPLTVGSDVTIKGLSIAGSSFSNVSSSTMYTIESVPLPPGPGGSVTFQIVMAAGEDLVATAQAVGATTSLSLLDAQGHILIQSDGLSAAETINAIDTYIGPGTYSLQVHDISGSGNFTLMTTLTPASAPLKGAPIPTSAEAVVAGDFNGDGRLDLAVVGLDDAGAYEVSVLLGNGDGTFEPAIQSALGPAVLDPYSIVAGDFNGDGHLDLAIADPVANDVSVSLGNGNGTFEPPVQFAVGSTPDSIVAGDFNGDGHLDLAVANDGPSTVSVLLGDGDGTFRPAVQYAVGSGPFSIVAGDFNGDGRLDLATATISDNDVSVLLGNGNGTFQPQVTYAVGSNPDSIVAGDFNGDGRLDLAVTASDESTGASEVFVLLSNSDGTFQPAQESPTGGDDGSMMVGDFNGDGNLDLVIAGSDDVSVLLGKGNGTFEPAIHGATGPYAPNFIAVGYFNGDGQLDLARANDSSHDVSVLLGNGDGTFQSAGQNAVESDGDAIVAGDFNGDGRLDLAVASSGEVSILLGNGNGTFQPAVQTATGSGPGASVAGDFNGDGRLDLAVVNGSNVAILLGNGDGTFGPAVQYAVDSLPFSIVAGDFNGDGHLDLAVGTYNLFTQATGGEVSVLLGNGDGTFQPQVTYAVGSYPDSIVAGDFNGDGKLDLATSNFSSNDVSILLGNGDGTFQPAQEYPVLYSPDSIVAGDLNGDGHLDLAVADFADNDDSSVPVAGVASVLLGNGDGTFQPAQEYAAGNDPESIVAGDFDGDGRLDLAVSSEISNDVARLLGNGDGGFEPAVQYGAGLQSPGQESPIVAANFNGDGQLDLAVMDETSSEVSILLGNRDGTFSDPAQFGITPHDTPLVADVNGDRTEDTLVIDGAGNILYRQGVPGQPGTFEPPVTVNPPLADGMNPYTSRDIAWVPDTLDGPLLASADAQDANVSLYAYRNGTFVRVGSLTTGQLPAQIIAADLSGTGWADLVVSNAGDGTLSIYYSAGDKTVPGLVFIGPKNTGNQLFGFPVTLSVGIGVSDLQAVDTTGDGRLDLVVTNKLTGQVSILLNLGGGKFAVPVPYRAGTGLSEIDPGTTPEVTSLEATAGVAAGAFTTGGPTDLVTINPGSETLDVLVSLGGGRFANPVTLRTANPAQVVRVADFNHDGIPDLAVLTADGVTIYLGNGKGGFASPVTYTVPSESSGLTVADVNRDGDLDLLVGDAFGDVLVLLGNGNGTFAPYHDANQSVELAVANLSGNGTKDIVYADQSLDRVVVDYGAGNLQVRANQSNGLLDPGAVTLADLNGDNIPDLIVANSGSNNVLIYPGLGNGQFGPGVNDGNGYFVGTNPVGITVADLTGSVWPSGEPRLDLVVADEGSNDVAILLNQGNFSFDPGPRLSSGGTGPVSTLVGDFTAGSKLQDILVTNNGSDNVTLLQGVGDGFFKPAINTSFPVHKGPVVTFAGTFTGNTPGLVTVNAGSDDLTLTSNFEGPDPVTTTISSGGLDPDAAFVFEDDGFDDLVVGNSDGDGVLAALLKEARTGWTLMSTQVEPDLPSPTALAYSALTGGQIQFYAATSGHDQADLISLSLAAETPLPPALPGPSNPSPTLVSSEGSSLPLVAVVLTLTIEVSANELSLPLDEAGKR